MTSVYFVRHAQSVHSWEDDRTRPLTEEGEIDSKKVVEILKKYNIDCFYSSPYKRSVDTIRKTAEFFNMNIITDERLIERRKGFNGNNSGMFKKRWSDFNYHEKDGESLLMVQKRNINCLEQLLVEKEHKNIVIGTHGTALSTILNYYNSDFSCDDFIRIIDYMPYIICIKFKGTEYISQKELLVIEKEYKRK